MIKAAIFDFGNVLFKTMWDEADNMIKERNGFGLFLGNKATERQKEIFKKLNIGKSQYPDLVKTIKPELKDPKKILKDYREAYLKFRKTNEELMKIISELQKKKIKIFGFTDTIEEHYKANKESGFCDIFEEVFTSFDFGVLKSDPLAFSLLTERLSNLNIEPKECIFVDDKMENIQNARVAGFHAIHYPYFPDTKELEKEIFELINQK